MPELRAATASRPAASSRRSLAAPARLALVVAVLLSTSARAQEGELERLASRLPARELGPAVHGGRVVDLAVHPSDASHFYVASASGGVFKTVNAGTTFTPIFDHAGSLSIGDIALAPSKPEQIWVGTGESNNQRSSYWGDGVYKSEDGGLTWRNTGLRETQHIGRIVVHPKDPQVVYVAALGRLYGFNRQRGVFKTTDGGATWQQVLFVSEKVGVVDLVLDPRDPETIYAAAYERLRKAWHLDGGGPGSGIYKSSDGARSWRRLMNGLPEGEIGRIGLDAHAGEKGVVIFATVENMNPRAQEPEGDGPDASEPSVATDADADAEIEAALDPDALKEDPALGAWPGARQEAAPQRPLGGEIYRSDDGGETWTRTNTRSVGGSPGYYYGQIRIDPSNPDRLYVLSVPVHVSEDGGKTWKTDGASSVHVDHHALWIDPKDSRHLLLGNDGGLYVSRDRGKHWEHLDNLPIAQYYAIGVDQREPYHVYGGTQDNGSWMGRTEPWRAVGVTNTDWVPINGGDGFYTVVDPWNPNTVYTESQFGALSRIDVATGERKGITPRAPKGETYRFNWNSPIALSPHNARIVYFGGNKLFRSLNRGDEWQVISPDLTTADAQKLKGNVPHCTITTIAESPLTPGELWVGTDDGKVQLSRDGGQSWTDVRAQIPNVPAGTWVSRVWPSSHVRGRAYVSLTGYRDDDFRPWVFRTEDYGQSFEPIASNLPPGAINIVLEDAKNPDLLFVGAEYGLAFSIDRGERWGLLRAGLPNVAIYDLAVQPKVGDLVVGTHGRGMYAIDISPLQGLSFAARNAGAALSDLRSLVLPRWLSNMQDGFDGDLPYAAPPAERELAIGCALASDDDGAKLEVLDEEGKLVAALEAPTRRGAHIVRWDLQRSRPPGEAAEGEGPPRAGRAGVGRYSVRLRAGGTEVSKPFEIRRASFAGNASAEDAEAAEEEERGDGEERR